MPDPLLSVQHLSVSLPSDQGTLIPIVRNVSFQIQPGEFTALVGESGCGKSMTAMALTRLPPTDRATCSGSVLWENTELLSLSPKDLRALRGRALSYVFQDPQSSLNPVLSVRTQLREALPPQTPRDLAENRIQDVLETVRISDPKRILRSYPHELSGGLQQRVGIAMAVAASPKLLIADEPTTALDTTTQKSVLDLLNRIRQEQGIAILLITHNLGLVARYADSVHVMYAGEIVESGPVLDVLQHPAHPYTHGLLAAVPSLDLQSIHDLQGIPGRVPMPTERPSGCAFAPRCPKASPTCRTSTPTPRPLPQNPRHLQACLRDGFSLLEVIAVILILALLSGFVVGQARLAKVRGEEARARTDLGRLHQAIERYRSALGHYPSSSEVLDSSIETHDSCIFTNLTAWTQAPTWMMPGVQNADTIYCLHNFLPEIESKPFSGLDPWNRPYRYYHDPSVAPDSYRLFSFGPADPSGKYPDRWIFFEE